MNAKMKTYSMPSEEVRHLSEMAVCDHIKETHPRFRNNTGGGGTFAVVMEATILASPRVTLQTLILKFPHNNNTTQAMWQIMVDNGLKWANDGWGGFAMANVLVLVNPRLNKGQATESLAPLIDFGAELQDAKNGRLVVMEFPSWGTFFNAFTRDHVAVSLALQHVYHQKMSKADCYQVRGLQPRAGLSSRQQI